MTKFQLTTAEDLKTTRFGSYLLEILERLELQLPLIKGLPLQRTFHKAGCWGVKAIQIARNDESIIVKVVSDSKEQGINLVIQELVARLCGLFSEDLKGHYSDLFGRRDAEGTPVAYDAKDKGEAEQVSLYLQDLEFLVDELRDEKYSELLRNDELCASLSTKEEEFKKQEERFQAQEEKFQAQEKRFKSQEKRVQDKNKRIRELKTELESNDMEFEADRDLIKRLRAEKKELQEKVASLDREVKELQTVLIGEGIQVEFVEEEEKEEPPKIEGKDE